MRAVETASGLSSRLRHFLGTVTMSRLFKCSVPRFPHMKMAVLMRPAPGGRCIKSCNTLGIQSSAQ